MPKRWGVALEALLLLFAFPLPLLVPFDGSDLLFWLITWFPAVIVGLITAMLVKSPGKKQTEHATGPLSLGAAPKVRVIFLLILLLIFTLRRPRPDCEDTQQQSTGGGRDRASAQQPVS